MKSYKDIVEALKGNQHKIDKNKNGKIDAHDFKLLRKEETELTEATVKTQKYSWGTMKTVHHGADFSIPLHPEHHQEIAKLKDNQEHKFKDETGRHWTAKRMGDDVHFHSGNDGPKTKVKHADLKESVGEDEEDRMARADYKVSPSGRKSHKEIVFKHGEDKKEGLDEKAPPGFEGTVKAMKKHKDIDNPYALAWYMKNKGMKSHKKADGTMKEDLEHIEERNKQNATMRKMMDASRGARYKASGNPVPDREPEHKTAQAHNKAIGRALRNEEKKEDVPFDGPYTKVKGDVKDKSGAVHTPMSKAKHLARMAIKKQMKEDIDRLFEKDDSEYNYEGEMAVTQLKTICRHAEALEAKLKPDTNLPEWVQSKITLAMDYMQTAHDYLMSELDEQAPVAPVPGQKWKDHAVMVNGKQRVVIKRSNVKNYPDHEGWKEVSPGQKLKEDDEVQFSYTELMMMVEGRAQYMVKATHKDSGRVRVTTYVADKDETEGSVRSRAEREHKPSGYQIDSIRRKDVEAHGEGDDEETSSTTQKRGRGRPAGSKSGARGPRIK